LTGIVFFCPFCFTQLGFIQKLICRTTADQACFCFFIHNFFCESTIEFKKIFDHLKQSAARQLFDQEGRTAGSSPVSCGDPLFFFRPFFFVPPTYGCNYADASDLYLLHISPKMNE
jgi:hypothetical protein